MFHFWRVSKDAQNPFSSRYGPIWDPIWDPIWGHNETYWRPLWTTPMAHILVPVGTPHSGVLRWHHQDDQMGCSDETPDWRPLK